jgi:hypothetical protein
MPVRTSSPREDIRISRPGLTLIGEGLLVGAGAAYGAMMQVALNGTAAEQLVRLRVKVAR